VCREAIRVSERSVARFTRNSASDRPPDRRCGGESRCADPHPITGFLTKNRRRRLTPFQVFTGMRGGMNDDHTPHRAMGKRKSPDGRSMLGGLFDLADRSHVAMLALIGSTLVLIATDIMIRAQFGTVKVRTGWIGNWDAAINSDNGWACFLVIMAWLAILARCVSLSRQAAR
jgi:hypothetical protein